MAQSIRLWGATYSNVPGVDLPKSTSGTARFTDVTDTTATASDVASGKYFYTAAGVRTQGTGSGGGGGVQIGTFSTTAGTNTSIAFPVSGNPTSFVVCSQHDISTSGSVTVCGVVYDGVSIHTTTAGSGGTSYDSMDISSSYSDGVLTLTTEDLMFSTGGYYKLVYTYNGASSDIHTANVQVGSGATSITFPSLSGRPIYWSCIFKNDFSTSSGYQRVMEVVNDGSSIYGLAMDSSAKAQTSWTASYSGGNLTINSQGTNNGGYFHQPGYYQLTYCVDESAPQYQSKTVTPTTSQQTVTPDTGYDALSEVTVNAIPSEYIIPTGNLAITQNGTGINVAQYATVSVNVSGGGGASNLVTGTFKFSQTSASAQSITLDYSGTGYPIACIIVLDDGVLDETFTNTVARYAIAQYFMTKTYVDEVPTYITSGTANQGAVATVYKSSSSTAATLTRTSSATANTYSSSNATGNTTTCVRFRSKTSMSIYAGADSGTSRYGFLNGLQYRYWVIYSA